MQSGMGRPGFLTKVAQQQRSCCLTLPMIGDIYNPCRMLIKLVTILICFGAHCCFWRYGLKHVFQLVAVCPTRAVSSIFNYQKDTNTEMESRRKRATWATGLHKFTLSHMQILIYGHYNSNSTSTSLARRPRPLTAGSGTICSMSPSASNSSSLLLKRSSSGSAAIGDMK